MHASRPWLFALCFAVLGVTGSQAARAADSLRVMTFNVRLPLASDGPERWEARRDLFVKTIRDERPDVFGTQELYKEQGDYVVAKLPEYKWFGMGRKGGDGDEHMGVFYRRDALRVLDSGNFWLSDTPDVPGSNTWGTPFPRMVTWARFQRTDDGRTFVLFDTHLPYRAQDDAAREKGAAVILERIAKLPPDEPFVLTGDFNTKPASRVHAMLTAHLHDAWLVAPHRRGPDKTFHAFTGEPTERIDWILVRGFRVKDARTVTTHQGKLYPSDHFPVTADLLWPVRRQP
ncbi:MAG: endonuclease/exonuclease/phosphatase family protein [Xanthomonadales bacterium]|nr:endonuclease/exonuclease/phosphatase family protein [Xanthomonadales bacterium]